MWELVVFILFFFHSVFFTPMEFVAENGCRVLVYERLGMVAVNGKLISLRPKMRLFTFTGFVRSEKRGGSVHMFKEDGTPWQISVNNNQTPWSAVFESWADNGTVWARGGLLYVLFYNNQQENGFANTLCLPKYIMITSLYIDKINPKFRRVQRWIRAMAIRRKRKLALAMTLHHRLGAHSALAVLGGDCVESVAKFILARH
jgi:hypothetical protein